MRKFMPIMVLAMAVLGLPELLKAQEPPKPPRPNPESMFKRLDANKDGVVTKDELPEGMPERLKELVLKADKNGDSQVSLEELLQAMKDRKPEGKPEKGPDAKPEKRPEGKSEKRPQGKPEKRPERGPEGRPGPRAENGQPHGFGGPGMGRGMGMPPFGGGWGGRPDMARQGGPHGRPGSDQAAFGPPGPGKGEGRPAKSLAKHSVEGIRDNLPQMPNLKVIFERLDADKDGKLNFEEFKSGAIKMHRLFAAQEKAQKSPKTRHAGMQPNWQNQPWQGMHRGGWGMGPRFHGNGPWGHQAQANGPWGHHSQGYGQHFRGYGPWGQSFHGFGPGPQQFGPHFQHGFAMNHFPGPGPQFNNERRDYDGPGPKNREQQGPRSHDREPSEGRNHDRGPHSDRSWWD